MSNPMKLTRRKAIKIDDAAAGKKIFGTKHSMSVSEEEFGALFEQISGGLHVSQLNAVMLEARKTMFAAFKMGGTVHIPYFGTIRVVGQGKQDPDVNEGNPEIALEARLLVAKPIKTALAAQGAIPYDVVEQAERIPTITSVFDKASKTTDETLTPDGVVRIEGTNLRFNETKSDEGLYLIPTVSGDPIVKIDRLQDPEGTRLMPVMPVTLVSGTTYQFEVRSRPQGTRNLRIGRYAPIFTVA